MLSRLDFHDYQETATAHALEHTHSGLFLDMGLGKTIICLTVADVLINEYLEVTKVLVIGTKRVAESVWSAESKKWEHTKHLNIVEIKGTEKQRRKCLATPADIHTIARDNVAWLCAYYGGSMLPYEMVIVDESSSFKNHDSVKFKAFRRVLPSLCRIIILTGTPAPNGYLDLWAQIFLLDRGKRLGKFITIYRDSYFVKKYSGWGYQLRPNSEAEIQNLIKDICISMKSEDYLDLPPVIHNDISLSMSPYLLEKYRAFEKESVLQLFEEEDDEKDITALNAAALSNKLMQFSNGAVYDKDRNVHHIHNIKIQAAKEIVDDAAGKPVLIAWAFKHDRDRLLVALKKYKPRQLDTDQDIQDWNAGKVKVLLMHPASGGHGLNLQHGGNILLWFGLSWSLELYMQLNKRLDRQGQTKSVIIHKLLLDGTIDNKVLAALSHKQDGQDGLMQAVKAIVRRVKYGK